MRSKILPEIIQDDKALSLEYINTILEQIEQKLDEEVGLSNRQLPARK
ncbi:MAG: hypothetical protein WDO19_17495 [Bacteroidota bacterium]